MPSDQNVWGCFGLMAHVYGTLAIPNISNGKISRSHAVLCLTSHPLLKDVNLWELDPTRPDTTRHDTTRTDPTRTEPNRPDQNLLGQLNFSILFSNAVFGPEPIDKKNDFDFLQFWFLHRKMWSTEIQCRTPFFAKTFGFSFGQFCGLQWCWHLHSPMFLSFRACSPPGS